MTEKRFEIKIGEFEEENIVDNLNKRTICEISDMCKKMNDLHEENQILKERRHGYQRISRIIAIKYNALEKENKELKSKCDFMETVIENKGYSVDFDGKKGRWVIE